jgi:hypothetical protein
MPGPVENAGNQHIVNTNGAAIHVTEGGAAEPAQISFIIGVVPATSTLHHLRSCDSNRTRWGTQNTGTIENYCRDTIARNMLRYPILLHSTPRHSHSIVPNGFDVTS